MSKGTRWLEFSLGVISPAMQIGADHKNDLSRIPSVSPCWHSCQVHEDMGPREEPKYGFHRDMCGEIGSRWGRRVHIEYLAEVENCTCQPPPSDGLGAQQQQE